MYHNNTVLSIAAERIKEINIKYNITELCRTIYYRRIMSTLNHISVICLKYYIIVLPIKCPPTVISILKKSLCGLIHDSGI
jgi:hypothetical protein